MERIRGWQDFVRENQREEDREKLVQVNNYFNRFKYVEDEELYGQQDYWATPRETLSRGSGDCEDLAIAKYFTLLGLNFAEANMRITYVIAVQTRKPHMVLTCWLSGKEEPLVLDTMVKVLLPVSRRNDLVPVYSFNRQAYWLARKDEQWGGEMVGPAEKLSLWSALLQRMDRDAAFLQAGIVY